jgi:4-amino-4-deoxy-L-arabinose transferase-like glycosyltransferase
MAQGHGGVRADDAADRLALAMTALLVAAVWALHLPLLTVGGISHYDEFYTLDRAVSFARMDDWLTVFSGNEPSFRKPPLQYWMTAGLLAAGVGETAALRLPSMLFALGMLGTTAWLARLLSPDRPWAMPLAVGLLASSLQFWTLANSAMLDTGAGFFAAAAVATAIAALERPRLWGAVALLVGLGALQKAPAGFVFVAAALAGAWAAGRWTGTDWPRVRDSQAFRRAAWLALGLVLAWPLLQAARHGMDALGESHDRQMFARFAPDVAEGVRGLGDLARLIVAGEPWLRWPALAAALALPFVVRRPGAAMVAAVVAVYVLALTVAGGTVYPRYVLTILPLLMAALAALLVRLPPAPWAGLALGAALAALNGGPVQTVALGEAARQPEEVAKQVAVLRGVGAEIVPGETLVYCWTRGARRLVPGAVAVYASNGQPMMAAGDAARDGLAGPARGNCPDWEFADDALHVREVAVVREEAGYVIFTAGGTR